MLEPISQTDSIQAELKALFAKAKLPTSPVLAAQLLELADNPSSTVDEFAELIRLDPILSARLLKLANSSHSAQRSEVTTIQRAVILLGINRVRTLGLSFQLIAHLDKLGKCPFDIQAYWKHSLLRGCLAREFAEVVAPSCAEEAFLVGLLQDCGILFLVQLLGMEYAEFVRSFNGSRTAFYEEEKERFRFDHAQTVGALAREWKLPKAIVGPLEVHHTKPELSSDSTDLDLLSGIGYLVGSIGLADGVVDDPGLAEYAGTDLGLDEELLRNCIQRAGEAYSEVGRLLQETLPDDLDVTDLLSRANACLNSAAREAEQRADVVKAERDEYAQQQVHLKHALGEYRERAARDPLTGILNRGALVEAACEQLRHAREQGRSITVLFLDIDNFKSLNDRFGHQAGDNVLIGLAEAIGPVIRNSGIFGRYGGEEFVAIVGGLLEAEARQFAEEVVDTCRRTEWPGLGLPGPVTCSLGAVWGIPGQDECAEGLFAAADGQMYEAKRAGKDRAVCRSLSRLGHKAKSSAAADALVTAIDRQDMAESSVVLADYIRIAKELSQRTPSRFSTNRKQKRKQLIAPCKIATFTGANFGLSNEVGCVRDISSGGIGLLTSTHKRRSEPIEVAIHTSEKPSLYVAGIVAWCRHIEGCVHEVGVQLLTHAREPIFSVDPISAIRNLDWVASALTTLTSEAETGGHQPECTSRQ